MNFIEKIKNIFISVPKKELNNNSKLVEVSFDKFTHSEVETIIYSNNKQQTFNDVKNIKVAYLNDPASHIDMIREFVDTLSEDSFLCEDKTLETIKTLQEFIPKKGAKYGHVEILNDKFLYYHRHEDLVEHWDLKDCRVLEEAHLNVRKNEKENITFEELEKRESLANKYKMLRKNYMIIGNGKKEWNKGKKIIGMFIPNSEIINFYFDDIIFISPDVAQKQYGSQDKLDIFDKEKGIVYTSRLYAFIATKGYSDLLIYQFDSNLWAAYAVKDGKNIEISKEAFTNEEAHMLIQALLQDMEENTNNQDFNVTGTVHKNSFDKTNLGEDAEVPIGDKTFRIDMSRQYKSSISKGSQNFARTINIRMLETGSALRKLHDIGYHPDDLKLIQMALIGEGGQVNVGCIVYAGAPSSGKSTSLYSLFADLYDSYQAQIVTIDSSVEFEHKGFRQISLDDTKRVTDNDRKMTISKVTNNMLKQYANAMMIGEVRDDEQIMDFIKAAERGRLMAATMHTNDVKSIFTVLENTGLKPYQYIPSLRLLVHHALVPRMCPKCLGKGIVNKFTEEAIIDSNSEKEIITCKACSGIGSVGRALIYEIAYLVPGKIPLDCQPSKDFDDLVEKGAILYRSKESVAKMRLDNKEITRDLYDSISGKYINEMNKKFKKLNETLGGEDD